MSTNEKKYSRIVYSPEVQVFILPGSSSKYTAADPIDISEDIIEGSITRTTEGVSTASFLVQSRKLKDNSLLLSSIIRPMDRIVVYLKKVKPILVFSGYLDLVPLFQAVPEPFTIEASCTLKRLEFTYWDPQLPHVYEHLASFGFAPSANGQGGLNFFVPLGSKATGTGSHQVASGPIQDTGFGAMLYFLLHEVGGWDSDSIWIEPLPVQWMQRAYYLFQVSNDWNERYNTAQSFLKSFLTSGGTGGGGSAGGGTSGGADSAAISEESSVKSAIEAHIRKNSIGSPVMTADDFVVPGKKYNVDPRFLAALAFAETHYGTDAGTSGVGAVNVNNCYGYGYTGSSYQAFSSFTECVDHVADVLGSKKYNYYLGDDPNQTTAGMLVHWNKSSPSEKVNIETAWRQMATANAKVDVNKPYSIIGQGIGSAAIDGGGAGSTTRSTVNSSPTGAFSQSNDVVAVYIEAGHAGSGNTRQPGYQGQDGTSGELKANINMVNKINEVYDALPDADKNKLNIRFVTDTSRPRGVICDVYLSIHHDPDYATTSAKIGHPSQYSYRGNTPDNRTIDPINPTVPTSGPNRYSVANGGGPGFRLPESGEGGRNSIKDDAGLIKNSKTLSTYFEYEFGRYGGIGLEDVSNNGNLSNNRPTNYYGFYYSISAACALIELPSVRTVIPGVLGRKYDIDNVAKAIIQSLLDYQSYKSLGKQQQIKKGSNYNLADPTTTQQQGDNSPASKVIAAALKAVEHNQQNWDLPYHMDSSDRANGKTIEEVIQGKLATDCSSFINCCMKSAGIAKNAGETTYTLNANSVEIADKTKYEPGMLFNSGGHVVLVVSVDGKTAESNHRGGGASGTRCTGKDNGPQSSKTADYFASQTNYKLYKHNDIGTTLQPPSGGGGSSSGGSGGGSGSTVDPFLIAKSTAFNVAFNFPGSMLDSVLLTGERALENDVKLLDTIQEVCKASQRTFSSLPNGDFIAWYPDYFNLTGSNSWLKVSPTEIKSCTISLNDKNLVTHLYILGNPFGFDTSAGSNINLEWYEKLMGSGVVTIERPWVLDSFLRPFEKDDVDQTANQTNTQRGLPKIKTVSRPRPIIEAANGRLEFLERYGARPYMDKIPTIRHPILEFFYAYHTFIQKWAEQFISKAEFTFMPELFPGMIIELEMKHGTGDDIPNSFTFYVKDVNHTFSYESGFSTSATLIAPGTTSRQNDWSMVLVNPPNIQGNQYKKNKTIKISNPNNRANARTVTRPSNSRASIRTAPSSATSNALDFPSITQVDGGNL